MNRHRGTVAQCHSTKTKNCKAGVDRAAPSKLITFFKISALLLIILGLSNATASFSKAAEIEESLTTTYQNSVSGYGETGSELSNAAPTMDADRALSIEDEENVQYQPQAMDSALCIRDMDIKTLLRALSLKHKVSIVSTPAVAGRISLNLKQTSLEDTLTAISRIMGLIWSKEGSVYILSQDRMEPLSPSPPVEEGGVMSVPQEGIEKKVISDQFPLTGENTGNGKLQAGVTDLDHSLKTDDSLHGPSSLSPDGQDEGHSPVRHKADPKSIKVFHINYADLKELSKVIQWSFETIRTTVYPQDEMILVEGDSKEIALVQGLIQSLDVPPRQTLIEAQILEINLSDDMTYGIDWSGTFSQGQNTSGLIGSPGTALPSDSSSVDPSSQFLFGILKPHFYIKLSALEKKGDVKTLAKPRIMVLDGKSAQILIGGRLGYYLTTTTQTTTVQSVEFLDIGTQLKLVPHIAEDGNILMDIQPEVSDGSLSSGLPQKTTTSVSTSVMVKAGETIFIGGLIRNSEIKQRDRLPVLGHIPVLGNLLFSKVSNQTQRKELVILLTPYLVSNSQKAETRGQEKGEISPCPPISLSSPTPPVSLSSPQKEASPGVTQNEIEHWKEKMEELGGKEETRELGLKE